MRETVTAQAHIRNPAGTASSGRAVVSSDDRPFVSLIERRHHARRAGIAMPSVGCAEPAWSCMWLKGVLPQDDGLNW